MLALPVTGNNTECDFAASGWNSSDASDEDSRRLLDFRSALDEQVTEATPNPV